MNHIHALQQRAAEADLALQAMNARVDEFRVHIAGAKFQGFEDDGSRKDWIATTDVNRWIEYIRHGGR